MTNIRRYAFISVAAVAAVVALVSAAVAATPAGSRATDSAGAADPSGALASGATLSASLAGGSSLADAGGTAPQTDQLVAGAQGSLSLSQAMNLAEQHNLQLRLADLKVPMAQAAQDRADATATAGGPALAQALLQRYGVQLPADETTAAAFRQAAESGVEQATQGKEVARQAVRMAVTQAFVAWQKADAGVTAQQAAFTRATAQAESIHAAQQAGTAAQFDALQADAQVSAQKAALAGAQASLESARLGLERLLGITVDKGTRPADTLPAVSGTADLPEVEGLVAKALSQRPEVKLGGLVVAARQADLDLLGRYRQADDPAITAARLAVQEATLQLESARADIRLQVQQALLGISGARERLAALTDSEAAATEAVRLAGLRFDAGTATSTELLGAQAALSQAEAARIQAAADLAAATASLEQATGDWE